MPPERNHQTVDNFLVAVGGYLGADCYDKLITCHSQAEICTALIDYLNAVNQFAPGCRQSVVGQFAVLPAPMLEDGINAIRERG